MDTDYVSRSRLFRENFLPGAYANLRNKAYGMVVGSSGGGSALDGIDKEQLLDVAIGFARDWESNGGKVDPALKVSAERKKLEVQSPSTVYVTPSPTMLYCKKCKAMDFIDSRTPDSRVIESISRRIKERQGRPYIGCRHATCNGEMIQIPYAAVHRCGFSSAIHIHHQSRANPNLGYKDEGSFFHSYLFDVATGNKLDNTLQDDCPACKKQYSVEVHKRGTPLTSGESFFSQTVQYIAMSEERGKLLAKLIDAITFSDVGLVGVGTDIAEAIITGLLRCAPSHEIEKNLITLISGGAGSAEQQARLIEKRAKKQATIDKLRHMADDEDMASLLESAIKEVTEIDTKLSGSSGSFKAVRNYLDDADVYRTLFSHRRTVESVFLEHDVNAISVDDAILQSHDAIQRDAMQTQWDTVRNRYGIDSISHIPDLRVVLATIGYSREKATPSTTPNAPPVVLNGFVDLLDSGMQGKTPVYAMSAQTEALWIRLDPCKVLRWCVESAGWEYPENGILESKHKSLAHLLQFSKALTLPPGRVMKETAVEQERLSMPFHLLHTISHALMLTARRHTGYDDKSIQEYLMPMNLSFILYVSSVANYTAGGLLLLFQHYLDAWFEDASMFAFNCAFDPFCTDNGGACSGCVQTEIGCETFNHGLSRAYLHGGSPSRDSTVNIKCGYWSS